jgi:hypothetical protein
MKTALGGILTFLGLSLGVANDNVIQARFGSPQKLKYGVAIESHLRASANQILSSAMTLVQSTLKDQITLTQAQNQDFDFIIHITDRGTAARQDQNHELVRNFSENLRGDAFSLFFSDAPGSPVVVRVFWDEATTEVQGQKRVERPDAFARVVVLLGHEISGNVVNFLSRRKFYESPPFRFSREVQKSEALKSEVRAFKAGVEFLENLIRKFSKILPSKIMEDFEAALKRERALLEKHRANLPKNNVISLEKSCHQMLGP